MKDRQDNLEKLLEEELKEEADQILAELEADESLKNVKLPDDLDARMMERIQKIKEEKEAEARLSEKDREALRLGREVQMLKGPEDLDAEEEPGKRIVRFRKKRWKAYVLVAVAAVLAMVIGMTSIGETPMYTKVGKLNVGNREIVQIDSAREGENNFEGDDEESGAYDAIEEAFGVKIVRIQYRPEGVSFLASDIDTTLKRVYLFYQYKEDIIEYQVMLNYLEQSAGYDVEDVLLEEKEIKVSNVSVKVKKYMLPDKQGYQMVAEFKYKDVCYVLNAPIDEREFLNIIENLIFL